MPIQLRLFSDVRSPLPQTGFRNNDLVANTVTFDNSQNLIIAGQENATSEVDMGTVAVNVISDSHKLQAAATIQRPTTVDASAGVLPTIIY